MTDLEKGGLSSHEAGPPPDVSHPNLDPSQATDYTNAVKQQSRKESPLQEQLSNANSTPSHHDMTPTTEGGSPLTPTRAQRFRSEMRRITMHFTPSWFSCVMGTGIVSVLLHQLPYQFTGLGVISNVIFGFNVLLFLLFLAISIARYVIWPQLFWIMLFHPTQSLFLGTFVMGMTTLISMCAISAAPAWGGGFITFTWVFWWINAALALVVCVGLPFVQFTRHVQSLDKITAVWMLPVVSTIVCSATGGLVAEILSPAHARLTLFACYVLWGTGFGMAFLLMSLYYARKAIYKIPPAQVITSAFLPIGPCGQGAFGLLQFASVLYDLYQKDGTALVSPKVSDAETVRIMATAIYAVSVPIALVIWGLGLVWLILAVSSMVDLWLVSKLTFNLGWFALVFPIGTMAAAAIKFGAMLDSGGFRVIGTVLALIVLLLWIFVSVMTMAKAFRGDIFFSPCLAEMCDERGEPPNYVAPARKYQYQARPTTNNTFDGNHEDADADRAASRSRSRFRGRLEGEMALSRARKWIAATASSSTSPVGRSRSRGRRANS
ncbi:hypothetical protein NDA18_000022 [Ustilago nuda]|nr:hypothetical protein NDA18_000022 [Ustilago nuda]